MKKLSPPRESGFTLIEVLIAMTIFAIGILAAITMQTTAISGNAKARYISEAANYATNRMEILLDTDYSTISNGSAVSGNYNISWTVANNVPVSNAKTLKVIVTNRLLNAPITITFVMAAGI